ncbi:MAG TPA: metal ABC transporter permease [Chthoniobacterales bacterium]
MNWLTEPFAHEFMQRAAFGCALIGFLNGFLGAFIVLRRLALMADALSHSLLPGLALGVLIFGLAPTGLFAGALAAALIVAIGSQLISRNSRVKEDTSIAILYTMAFSAGVILLNKVKSPVSLHHYLFGNILGLSNSDLWMNYGIALVTIPLVVALQRPLLVALFEPSVAKSQGIHVEWLNYLLMSLLVVTMISSLQAVGVALALGLLIAPAATIYLLSDSAPAMFWGGGILGALGSCLGLLISYWLNTETGPCIVLLLGLFFLVAYLLSPRYGLVLKLLRRRHFHEESLERWKNG